MPCLVLFLLFTLIPIVELWLLFWVAEQTSYWAALGLVITTGVIGAALARWQGWLVAWRIRSELAAQKMPTDALLDGLLILIAGVVLITPGVLTDCLGFALLIPPVRTLIKRGLKKWFQKAIQEQKANFTASFWSSQTGRASDLNDENEIELPFERSRIIDVKVLPEEEEGT